MNAMPFTAAARAASIVGTILLVLMQGAAAADPVLLKFGFPAPATSYLYTWGAAPWAEKVAKGSNGTAEVKVFVGGSVASFANVYDRTINGVIEVGFGTVGSVGGSFPRTNVSQLPYEARNAHEASLALWHLFEQGLIADDWKLVKVLSVFTLAGGGIHAVKPIRTLKDMEGTKLAIQNRMSGQAATLLGASPVTMTPSDLYPSLSRRLVEGTNSSWAGVEVFKLDEVTKYHVENPWGFTPAYIVMNQSSYLGLPEAARGAVDAASYEKFSMTLGDSMAAQNNDVRARVSAVAGHQIYELDSGEAETWKKRIASITEEWVKETPDGDKILAAFRAELGKIRASERTNQR